MDLSDHIRIADPSVNTMDQTSDMLGTGLFSPIQQWERYVQSPNPPIVVINFSLSNIIKGLLDILQSPDVAKPLSKFLKGVT